MENIRVIIADDSKETRSNVKQLLSFENYIEVVGEAENGKEAITVANKTRPDIILMDINMPVKDGIKATEELNLTMPETIVVMISVQSDQEYQKRAMSAGARGFLVKPFSSSELIAQITNSYKIVKK